DLLALPVNHDGEALAVIMLFRDNEQPFTEPAIDAMSSIADQMGDLLGRIIRVHHRAMPEFDEPKADDTYLPPSEWDGYEKDADPFDHDEDDMPF
ncbi:MAG: GAF domain-containing protein, partial [Planctomycetota bacterium]